ncbi:hypothetical protein CSC14_0676 [Proteus mirabilis]|nr:hypothetical protein CSC16_2447 [Proteus mirabilis]PVF71352.1 hypothetical protein CSC14_0676 [Proteus mirabilis]
MEYYRHLEEFFVPVTESAFLLRARDLTCHGVVRLRMWA